MFRLLFIYKLEGCLGLIMIELVGIFGKFELIDD